MDSYDIRLSDDQDVAFTQQEHGMVIKCSNDRASFLLHLSRKDIFELKEALKIVFDFPDDPPSHWERMEFNEGFL